MHNRALHDTLAAFVEEAAWQLAEEVSGGAEVPFELIEQGRSSAPLYCYKPLTQRFLAERAGSLGRLGSYVPAVQGLMAVPDLPSYLRARGRRPSGSDARSQADSALQAFVAAVWADATDFSFDRERFAAAYAELEEAVYAGCALSLVVTPVDGLVIESAEVSLGGGLTLVRGIDLATPARAARRRVRDGRRVHARASPATSRASTPPAAGCAACRPRCGCGTTPSRRSARRPGRAPTARRGSPSRSPPACAARPATACSRPRTRTRCARSARSSRRRTPRSGELAWALRRFELGCERGTALEALTDWLLCARALLAEPDALGYERMAERMAAICATPGERDALVDGLRRAIAMERAVVAGLVRPEPVVEEMVASLGSCLRAILRDVLCGHLDPDLRRVADGLLADVAPVAP